MRAASRFRAMRCTAGASCENGITLVETLMGIAIFAVGVAILLTAMIFCYGTSKINAHQITALALARKKIEMLINTKFSSISTSPNYYNELNVPLDSAGKPKANISVVVTADGSKRKRFAVTVSWNEQRRNHSVSLYSLTSNNNITKPS